MAENWNEKIIEEFRSNEGRVGGRFEGAPLLLLHTTGARTGAERVNPMMYRREGDKLYVFASFAGRDVNPAWFHNLVANPDVTVEVGIETFPAKARVTERPERDRIYDAHAEDYPQFRDYEQQTDRVIPVVEISRAA